MVCLPSSIGMNVRLLYMRTRPISTLSQRPYHWVIATHHMYAIFFQRSKFLAGYLSFPDMILFYVMAYLTGDNQCFITGEYARWG